MQECVTNATSKVNSVGWSRNSVCVTNLVEVTILALYEVEEEILLLVQGGRHDECAPLGRQHTWLSPRQRGT